MKPPSANTSWSRRKHVAPRSTPFSSGMYTVIGGLVKKRKKRSGGSQARTSRSTRR